MDTGNSVGSYSGSVSSLQDSSSSSSPSSGSGEDAIEILPGSSSSSSAGTGEDGSGSSSGSYTPETSAPVTATITSACNIRSYPDYGDNVIGSLYGGESVTYYGIEGGWAKIEYSGVTGYIGPQFIS